ncbi:MAG: hypothetical protein IJS78_06465 [Clostridia bacterium]|nr:hypothetical protein [Clostridia bacterium]
MAKKNEDGAVVSEELLGKLLGGESFRYDPDGDEIWKKYKDKYEREGRLAMKDTIGRALALTGGYGNTYAVTAGQEAYDNYASKLAGQIPELYRLALERYRLDRDGIKDAYSLLYSREKDAKSEESALRREAREEAKDKAEIELKKRSADLAERRAANEHSEAEAKIAADSAYKGGTVSAKERGDFLNYLLGIAKLFSSSGLTAEGADEIRRILALAGNGK